MLRDVLIQRGLSHREAEVAELVAEGLSNKSVANRLFVTEKTVKFHLTNIYKKMSVKSRAQLIVWCVPHFNFIENGARPLGTRGRPDARGPMSPVTNSIPAGSTTVSQQPTQPLVRPVLKKEL